MNNKLWRFLRSLEWRLRLFRYDRLTIYHADVKPRQYYDKDYLMVYFMFQLLVDYVEIECAAMEGSPLMWWERIPLIGDLFRSPRFPKYGIKYLNRQICDKMIPQSMKDIDREILNLYNWWTLTRPNRIDYDSQVYGNSTLSDREKHKMYKYCDKIDRQRLKEDQAMLIRLVKIRPHLWS